MNGIRGFDVIKFPIGAKITRKKIIIDKRDFEPCHGKEVDIWSHRYMKTEKWIVHVSTEGDITQEKIED